MAPERSPKRQKTGPVNETPVESSPSTPPPPSPVTSGTKQAGSVEPDASKPQQRSSWYSSWSRKAPPVTEVARESIKSASSAASEVASVIKDIAPTPKSVRSPSLAMTLGKGRPSRASLAGVATTRVHAEANSSARRSSRSMSLDGTQAMSSRDSRTEVVEPVSQDVTAVKEETVNNEDSKENDTLESSNSRASWLGWLARGDGTNAAPSKPQNVEVEPGQPKDVEREMAPEVTLAEPTDPMPPVDSHHEIQAGRKGWLSLWNANAQEAGEVEKLKIKGPDQNAKPLDSKTMNASSEVDQSKDQLPPQERADTPSVETSSLPTLPPDNTKASAWAFWSRDRKANSSSTSVDKPREGEIAVADTPSQNQPRKTSISIPKPEATKPELRKPEPKKPEAATFDPKSEVKKGPLGEITKTEDSKPADRTPTKTHKKQDSKTEIVLSKAESANAKASAAEPAEASKPGSTRSSPREYNLLLPLLQTTLKLPENPSLLLRLASLLYSNKEPELKHLSLIKDPPRIKNALAIGVHGYFPTPLIRSVIGQPTGTSIKFADMAAKSIKRWTSARGYECQVKTAALEGEGKIAERLELLWKLLLNWIEEIRSSDFIMVACHSQGVPVAIMLVAKLIQFGCVNSTRICICAMAGVNMGPFPEYKSRWIGGSAGELFEFSDPSSRVSTDYLAALDVVLKFGVHLTLIGSIDDQLVSLESSIYAPISHPHIFRAVSIDSRVHAPNFLSHLVGFALKLRNLGVQDHGLVRELSSPLAGSLYTGEGHSRIYEDDAVYDLALSFSLETNALTGVPLVHKTITSGGSNPYILPFAMRGILEEDYVKNELQGEASELLKEFDDWKPSSKVLKDVKFRLEGVRSKL